MESEGKKCDFYLLFFPSVTLLPSLFSLCPLTPTELATLLSKHLQLRPPSLPSTYVSIPLWIFHTVRAELKQDDSFFFAVSIVFLVALALYAEKNRPSDHLCIAQELDVLGELLSQMRLFSWLPITFYNQISSKINISHLLVWHFQAVDTQIHHLHVVHFTRSCRFESQLQFELVT